jgi:uncharacterized protein involved in response to NO
MKINQAEPDQHEKPLWRLAFRAGFLLSAIFAVLGMGRWLVWILWPAHWDFSLYPNWWHAHEMVFGFALPVVAGFLLSAVATWTGLPGTTGWRLQLLFGLWFAARIVLWFIPEGLPVAWLAEMLFILLLIFELTKRIWAVRQWRNMLFPPLLLLLMMLNSASYWAAQDPILSAQIHYGAVWIVTVLVVIVGGRVIPLFTGNKLGLDITALPPWLDHLTIACTVLIGLAATLGQGPMTAPVMLSLLLVGSVLHLLRLAHWQGWKTRTVPLLWSMHLSYLCIPAAMLALVVAQGNPVAVKNVIHLLAIGCIGGMILAMMSRVSLGHTGRAIEVPTYLSCAFGMVFLAAGIRAFIPQLDTALSAWAWRLSAVLWMMAFSLFLFRYIPVLTKARIDGKSG